MSSVGWVYTPAKFCPSDFDHMGCRGCEIDLCECCGEQLLQDDDGEDIGCPSCNSIVPQEWERQHEAAEAIIFWSDRNPESHTGWNGVDLATDHESVPSWWEQEHEDAEEGREDGE